MKRLVFNCTLIDVVGKTVRKQGWLLVDGERIAGAGSGAGLPEADERFDAQGGFVLPGLINMHVHIQRRHLHKPGKGVFRQGAAVLENSPDTRRILHAVRNGWHEITHGATTIRDCCSKNRVNNELRDSIREGLARGPRVVSCGFGIAGTGGHETHRYTGAVEADGPDEVRKAVRMEIKQHADFIKFMASGGLGGLPEHEHPSWVELTLEELRAGAEEAHNRNKTCTVHAMGTAPVRNAVEAGIDGIEHGTNLDAELVDLMKERGVYYVPTMSGIATVAEREAQGGSRELAGMMRELVVYPQRESVKLAHRAGLLIGAGTDTLGELVRELEMFHECGMGPMECLQTATINGAKILRLESEIGSLDQGKAADVLIVKADPLEDLGNLRSVAAVMKGGEWVTAEWLCGM